MRRAGPLSVRMLGDREPAIVLLHGLVGSGRFWGASYDQLSARNLLVVPDLLGFGMSSRPPSGYGPGAHALAVASCLEHLGIKGPVVIGAHSLGCVIALRLATLRPDLVERVVGFGPPLYVDAATARRKIGSSSPMARLFALPGAVAERTCRWVCNHRDLAAAVAPVLHPDVPTAIARDAVQHSWASYSETMERCLLDAPTSEWLPALRCPVNLVAGDTDSVVDHGFLVQLAATNALVTFGCWTGDHRLPLTEPARCRERIEPIESRVTRASSWPNRPRPN